MSATFRPSKIVPRPGDEPPAARSAKPKRNGSAAGARHMGLIAAMPCVLCELLGAPQAGKTDVHHIRAGAGAGQRNSDFLTVPLCHETCHQGPQGVHGDRSRLRLAGVTELDLLAITISRMRISA